MTKHMWLAAVLVLVVTAGSASAAPGDAARWRAESRAIAAQDHQGRVIIHACGCLAEAMANATAPATPVGSFFKSFLKSVGVQIQVHTLQDDGYISDDPGIAAVQGFIIGL